MTKEKKYTAWVLSDGRVGSRNQCIGVAERLPADIDVLKINDIEAAGSLSGYLTQKLGHPPSKDDWPDVILSSGDEAGKVAIDMKKLSGNKVFIASTTTHVGAMNFDFLCYIRQQKRRIAGYDMGIIGVPHKVNQQFIDRGVEEWRDKMQAIIESGKPIISFLIGGNINDDFQFDLEEAKQLAKQINREAKRMNAAVLITNSPRMTKEIWQEFRKRALDGIEQAYIHDCRAADGNPFPAMLGLADVIAVTGDSISMCSEAAATGKPYYIMEPPSISPPLYKEIHKDFYDAGYAKKFEGTLEPFEITAPPLDETGRVASALKKQLDKHLENKTQNSVGL